MRSFGLFSAAAGVLALVAFSGAARAEGIQGLTLDLEHAKFDAKKRQVHVKGTFQRPEWILITGSKVLVSTEAAEAGKRGFELDLDVPPGGALLQLMAVGPTGDTESAQFTIAGPAAPPEKPEAKPEEKKEEKPEEKGPEITQLATDPSKHFPWTLGLSATRINYAQDASFTFSEWALTARAGYTHVFASQRWEMGLTGFGTLLPFGASVPAGFTSLALRFYGLNARLGYRFAQSESGWAGTLQGGAYFTTTSSTGSAAFGFRNLAGPQFFPTITKLIVGSSPSLIGAYFKFSPVSQNLSLLRLSNREIAMGAFWRKSLRNGHPIAVAVDWSNLKLSDAVTSISVTTFGIGTTYYF